MASVKLRSILLSSIIFICSCNKEEYPDKIIKLDLQKEYDTAKWLVYASNYLSDSVYCYSKTVVETHIKKIDITSLPLQLDSISIFGDTITENFELKRVRNCRFAVH